MEDQTDSGYQGVSSGRGTPKCRLCGEAHHTYRCSMYCPPEPNYLSDLSKPMQALVDYMREHQSKIYRHSGGHWACRNCYKSGMKSFGTMKVTALVRDRIAEVTDWARTGAGYNYPAEMTLIENNAHEQ